MPESTPPPHSERPRILAWTGHRALAHPEPVRAAIRKVIAELRPTFGRGSAALGADLLVAEAFRDLTIPYTIILPYSRSDFEPNATPEEARRIDAILRDASTVTTLAVATEPYAQLMEELLRDADALLAVWDGCPARGSGGTAHTVATATSCNIPTIRLDPASAQIVAPDF